MAKKLKAKSLFELTFLSDAQLGPDGKRAVAVHTTIEAPSSESAAAHDASHRALDDGSQTPPRYVSHLFLYSTAEAGRARQLTQVGQANTHPRFSPSGDAIAFLSKREADKAQLYLLPLGGGEARRLTDFPAGVTEFCWHPGGELLALVSRGERTNDTKDQPRVIDRMFYKGDGVGFRPTESAQIYLCDLDGKTTKLTKLQSSPSGLVFTPDGQTLLFTAAEDERAADAWQSLLWALPLEEAKGDGKKGGKPTPLVSNLTRVTAPSPSPDGRFIALLSPTDQVNFATPTGLWVVAAEGGKARLLTGELEATTRVAGDSRYGAFPETPCWDGEGILVNLNREGRSGLARVSLEGRVRALHRSERAVTGFHALGGRAVFTAETPTEPGELFFRDARGKETRLSDVNHAWTETYRLSAPSPVQYARARGGPKVAYWTLEPLKPRKDRASVLQVHGGPHTNYGYGFMFEFQFLASQGYRVIYSNPRGSSSYGTAFATALQGRYGTVDADDVLAVADAAQRHHADPEAPMHLTGGSYGGFMTNWLLGHTDRFRSAVTQRSISNWTSFYGTSDIGYQFAPIEVGGTPWENLQALWDQSPLKYVANIQTPLLILHAEADHRCPIEQAEQLYIALKALGRPTRLIRFPDEGHELSRSGRPDRRVARLEALLEWFEEHP
jgi:dipeptidyl aminopeptidase/acylaminoacyl peptidase